MDVHLLVLEGKHQGLIIKLPPTQFVIGRDPTCHLRPASEDVSRFHCAIARVDRQIMVRDLKSKNGTYVNEQPVTGTMRANDGDVLRVGPLQFRFQVNVEPVSVSPGESGFHWLVRNPDEQESRALDPSHVTAIISCVSALPSESATAVAPKQSSDAARQATAVAGKFLTDYLTERKRSASK